MQKIDSPKTVALFKSQLLLTYRWYREVENPGLQNKMPASILGEEKNFFILDKSTTVKINHKVFLSDITY